MDKIITLKSNRLFIKEASIQEAEAILLFINNNKIHFEQWDPERSEKYYNLDEQVRRTEQKRYQPKKILYL